jgi:hypothetical protein
MIHHSKLIKKPPLQFVMEVIFLVLSTNHHSKLITEISNDSDPF